MCRPDDFGVVYEINPWMHTDVAADPDAARDQFEDLVRALTSSGASVDFLDPVPGLPDLVFTANAGIVDDHRFVPARFRFEQRQGETPVDVDYFTRHSFEILALPPGGSQEGAGDALPVFDDLGSSVLICGYRFRSDVTTHAALSDLLDVPTRSVELVDERLYHLDLCFCPVDTRRAIVAPLGLDRYGLDVVSALVPELLVLEDAESLSFCANSVVVGDTIVMPSCPPRVGRILESWGFTVIEVPVGEFIKAGGGCRCLTLALDVKLG